MQSVRSVRRHTLILGRVGCHGISSGNEVRVLKNISVNTIVFRVEAAGGITEAMDRGPLRVSVQVGDTLHGRFRALELKCDDL